MKQDRLKRKHRAAAWAWAAAGCALAAAALGAAPTSAAVLVLDDFTTGPVDALLTERSPEPLEVAGTMLGGARRINATIRFPPLGQAALKVDTASGVFDFEWTQTQAVITTIQYGSEVGLSGNAALNADWRAFEALEVVIDEVVGGGDFEVNLTDTSGENRDALLFDVTEPGVFRVSLAEPLDPDPLDLGSIRDLTLRWSADTADGRVVISEVRLVPEPALVGLLPLGAAAIGRRRRRA